MNFTAKLNSNASSYPVSAKLSERAHQLIPGGCHTYAKGDDQYPVLVPGFIARGSGCRVWDADGNEYIEYGMGNRAVSLGHAYPEVVAAAKSVLGDGSNFTRPATIEVACAEKFLELINGAEMVKFCKDGSDATSGAVRLARAYTGRDYIACCADHPFFSTDDWFIGTTATDAGVPNAVSSLTLSFRYNDLASVEKLFAEYPGKIAGLILEPARTQEPMDGFLHKVKDLCHRNGALFILDEMITGFRWHASGAQALYEIEPDLSCFGKALGNGFSVSALAGKREFMRLGGRLHTDRPRVFLLSTTHGAESHALAAAMAVIDVYQREPVVEHLHRQGLRLRTGIDSAAAAHGLSDHIKVNGRASCLLFEARDCEGKPSQWFRSLLLQEVARGGVLMPSLVVSYSHSDEDIDRTIDVINAALLVYKRALEEGAEKYLVGRPSEAPAYKRP